MTWACRINTSLAIEEPLNTLAERRMALSAICLQTNEPHTVTVCVDSLDPDIPRVPTDRLADLLRHEA